MARPPNLPNFDRPPVVEVALSVQFETIGSFRSLDSGAIWEIYRDRFPKALEQPPLEPTFETFGPSTFGRQMLRLEALSGPPPIRYWFLDEGETQLLQFQSDKIIHNWRKIVNDDIYPRYETIKEEFKIEIDKLDSFLQMKGWGPIRPNQCEATYVNHIELAVGTPADRRLREVFRFWNDTSGLPEMEDARFLVRYILTDTEGQRIGRLLVQLEPAIGKDKRQILVLTITARGKPSSPTISSALDFLDRASTEIVNGFAALTTPEMHSQWGRKP